MMLFIYINLLFSLICQSACGDFGLFINKEEARDAGDSIFTTEANQFASQGEISNTIQNEYDKEISGYRADEVNLNSTDIYSNETFKREEVYEPSNNTQSIPSINVSIATSRLGTSTTLTTRKVEPSTGSFNNNSQPSSPGILVSSTVSPIVVVGTTKSGSTFYSNASSTQFNMSSSEPDDEPEGVVIAEPSPSTTSGISSFTKTIYQKSIEFLNDTYAMSILVPVSAGVIFATSIIITIAVCRCCRRKCRRRRFRKKVLPDSVKNLRPSDRARLLAETSDEEF